MSSCRPHVAGRNCSTPEQGYFAGLPDFITYEAEIANRSPVCHVYFLKVLCLCVYERIKVFIIFAQNTQVTIREPYHDGREPTWTGVGFTRVYDDSFLEFDIDNVMRTMEYDLVVRYEPQVIIMLPYLDCILIHRVVLNFSFQFFLNTKSSNLDGLK